jgi:hypothetical protein
VLNGFAVKHVMYLMFPEVFIFDQKALYNLLVVLRKCLKQTKHSTKDMDSDDRIRFVSPS